jgi:hypothetical protein
MERIKQAIPLPEILDDSQWEIRNSGQDDLAYVDFEKQEMVVPFTIAPGPEYIRAHEAMHVAISPRNSDDVPRDIDNRTLQALEDARVNSGLKLSGVNISAQAWTDEMHAECALRLITGQTSLLEAARCLIAKRGTGDEEMIRTAIMASKPRAAEIADEIVGSFLEPLEAQGKLASWSDTVDYSRRLTELCEAEEEEGGEPLPGGKPGEGQSGSSPGDKSGDKPSESESESEFSPAESIGKEFTPGEDSSGPGKLEDITPEEEKEIREAGLERALSRNRVQYSEEKATEKTYKQRGRPVPPQLKFRWRGAPSFNMKVEKPRLSASISFKKTKTQKVTASDEGSIPRGMHRYATDQRIFARKGRRMAGAAILIDVSGSMGLEHYEVRQIIEQCPAAIVAVYSGSWDRKNAPHESEGILRIIAEGQRYSPDLNRGMPGENIIDYPALEWLARRKEKKKLWISDGLVTGETACAIDGKWLRKFARLIKENRIERVGNVRELLNSGRLIDHAFDDGNRLGRGK